MRSPGRRGSIAAGRGAFWREIAKGLRPRRRPGRSACRRRRCRMVPSRWRHATVRSGQPSGRYLSFAEREEIAILKAQGHGRAGDRPGGSAATRRRSRVSCAATPRPAAAKLEYRASVAQWKAELAARRPKVAKLVANPRLREYVQERLAGQIPARTARVWPGRRRRVDGPEQAAARGPARGLTAWSPEQIANRLPIDFPDDESMRISHEAIYQALYIQGRGALKRELVACLRTGRALRVPRARVPRKTQGARHPRARDQRAARRGRGPGHPGALGRRPDHRPGTLGDRHRGRAHDPLHDAGPPAPRGRATAPLRRSRTGPPLAGYGADRDEGRAQRDDDAPCPSSYTGR